MTKIISKCPIDFNFSTSIHVDIYSTMKYIVIRNVKRYSITTHTNILVFLFHDFKHKNKSVKLSESFERKNTLWCNDINLVAIWKKLQSQIQKKQKCISFNICELFQKIYYFKRIFHMRFSIYFPFKLTNESESCKSFYPAFCFQKFYLYT